MPLFIVSNDNVMDVFKHLFEIVENDKDLGFVALEEDEEPVTGPDGFVWEQVEYPDGNTECNGFQTGILKEIVNHTDRDIVIRGVDSEHHVQTDDQTPFVGFGGEQIFDVAIHNRGGIGFLFNGHDLEIAYDVTECNGQNYFAMRDIQDEEKILYPAFVILFHHLVYALHIDEHDDVSPPIEDVIQTENSLRNQFKCELHRSDTDLTVGCGFNLDDAEFPCPGDNFEPCQEPSGCFIASAAFGSPRAPQVDKFRGIRDLILRQTSIGDAFWEHLYAEYYQFSPQVAAEMGILPHLRRSISKLVVEPILDFYELLERYVRGGWQQESFRHQVEQILLDFSKGLTDAGFQPAQAEAIYLEIVRLKNHIEEMSVSAKAEKTTRPPASSDAVPILDYLASAVTAKVSSTTYLSWALMTPLTLYWQAVRQFVRAQTSGASFDSRFREQMNAWLGGVPVPPTFTQLSAELVLADLGQLADTVFSSPFVRRDFGHRLLESYGYQVPYDLEAILQKAGYLDLSSDGS